MEDRPYYQRTQNRNGDQFFPTYPKAFRPTDNYFGNFTGIAVSESLKNIGLEQHSSFFYVDNVSSNDCIIGIYDELLTNKEIHQMAQSGMFQKECKVIAAYTSDQLLSALGSVAVSINPSGYFKNGFDVKYLDKQNNSLEKSGRNLPDVLGKLLKRLIETKRISLIQANKLLMAKYNKQTFPD